jgi:hypothetical protein
LWYHAFGEIAPVFKLEALQGRAVNELFLA